MRKSPRLLWLPGTKLDQPLSSGIDGPKLRALVACLLGAPPCAHLAGPRAPPKPGGLPGSRDVHEDVCRGADPKPEGSRGRSHHQPAPGGPAGLEFEEVGMTGTRTRTLRSVRHLLAAAVTVVGLVCATTTPVAAHSLDRASSERRHVKRRARSQLGTDYTYGGTSPSSGFDCSGFTRWVFRNHGAGLPHSSMDQFRLAGENGNVRIHRRRRLKVGDLVFHKTTSARVGHAGIYVGRGKFISSTSSGGVRRQSIRDPYYWGPRWVGATRLRVTR